MISNDHISWIVIMREHELTTGYKMICRAGSKHYQRAFGRGVRTVRINTYSHAFVEICELAALR